MTSLTIEQVKDGLGAGFECKVVGGELRVFYNDSVTCFRWPLTFDWSVKMLRWHVLDRLGLRNPGLRPPPSNQSYNVG
jgi:hypothetical protein